MRLTFENLYRQVNEVLITFGNKPYPRSGHVVILAGGAASGKGFIRKKLLGIDGFVMDVDDMKDLVIDSKKLAKQIKDEMGIDVKKLDKNNPDDVSILHDIVGPKLNLPNKKLKMLYTSILTTSNPDDKPNLIFDVTLKDIGKLESICTAAETLGYDKEKIHIVWVLTDVEVAKVQNKNPDRGRQVHVDILVNSHKGAADTLAKIVLMGKQVSKYMDGAIIIAFNNAYIDTELITGKNGGSYFKKAKYVYLKEPGKPPLTMQEIADDILNKIKEYAPAVKDWKWKK